MNTLCLEIDYDYNFDLYGVVSSGKDYKLAWSFNKLLGLRLIKQKDLYYCLPDNEELIISNDEYSTEHGTVRLFRNKALGDNIEDIIKEPYLLPDIPEYDYVLQMTGELQQFCIDEFINKLQRIPLVQSVTKFDPLSLKFKDNLLF